MRTSSDDTHFRLMRMLEANPQVSQRELADHLDLSLGALNYCLRALVGKGLVKAQNFTHSRNKLGYAYLLTPAGIARKTELAGGFLKRKIEEYMLLHEEIVAVQQEISTKTSSVDANLPIK